MDNLHSRPLWACPLWASPPWDTYAHTPAPSRRVSWPGPFRGPPLRGTRTLRIPLGIAPATTSWDSPPPTLPPYGPDTCPYGPTPSPLPRPRHSVQILALTPLLFCFLSISPACLPPPVPSDPPPRSTAPGPPLGFPPCLPGPAGEITTLAPQGRRGRPVPPLVSPSGGAHLGVQVPVGPALPHLGGSWTLWRCPPGWRCNKNLDDVLVFGGCALNTAFLPFS